MGNQNKLSLPKGVRSLHEERRGVGASSQEDRSKRQQRQGEGGGFAFVTNIGHLPHDCHYFEIANCVFLKQATLAEVVLIKQGLQDFAQPLVAAGQPWETTRSSPDAETVRIQPEDWRYYVLSFCADFELADEIQSACDIAELELEIGMMFVLGPRGYERRIASPLRLYHSLAGSVGDPHFFKTPTRDRLEEIRLIREQLSNPELSNVGGSSFAQIAEMKALPHDSSMCFLGYFAILESLLTHAPVASDPYSSITKQVKSKLNLLSNRFSERLDYEPFEPCVHDTIWTKMYKYRSMLAHGVVPSFDGELKALRDAATALRLLRSAVRKVARHQFIEPQLLVDLRQC